MTDPSPMDEHAGALAPDAPPARVLVVEDDETVAEVLREVLQELPYDLRFATSAEEAMKSIASAQPDLILTDISLPGQSGLEVMRQARAIDPEVAVILMTGYASVQTAIDALRQGADDYVTKPFDDIADLPVMVEKRLGNRRLKAENRALVERLRRHEQELREKVELATGQMNALYRVAMEIGADLELQPRLTRIAATAAQFARADAAVVYLQHESTAELRPAIAHGVELDADEDGPRAVPPGAGPVGMAAFQMSPVRTRTEDGGVPLPGTSWTAREVLAIPMSQGGQPIGVMAVSRRDGAFTTEDQEFLSLFASQAAVQISNSQLFEHTKSLDRLKSDFVAVVSHEIRTPLTSVKGALELLSDDRYFQNNDQQVKLLTIAHANAERLLLLINDILDFSKLEAASLPMTIERQRLEPVVQQAEQHLRMLIEERRIQIEVALADDLPDALIDPHRIAQVLSNLMSNAIKFSPAGGHVIVRAESLGNELKVSVRDHGEGIAAADIAKLFRKFQQIDSGSTRKVGGTGLGLVISKGIVEQHGGRIGVDSTPGAGSTFWFTLPAAADGARSDLAA